MTSLLIILVTRDQAWDGPFIKTVEKTKISRPDQCDHMLKCCPKRSYGSFSLTEDFSKEAQEVNYYLGNFRKNFKKSPNLITLGQTFIFSEQNFNEKCELCVMRYWMK